MKIINAQFEYLTVIFFLLLFYIGKFFFNKILDRFWKKNIDTEYITTEKCEEHRRQMEIADKQRHDTLHSELKNINAQFKIFNSLFIKAIMTNSSLSEEAKTDAIIQLKNGGGD